MPVTRSTPRPCAAQTAVSTSPLARSQCVRLQRSRLCVCGGGEHEMELGRILKLRSWCVRVLDRESWSSSWGGRRDQLIQGPALVNGRVLAFLERFRAGAPLPPLIKVLFLLERASFDPLLSLPAAAISVVNESFAELLRCLPLFAVSRFCNCNPWCSCRLYNCELHKIALVRWLLVTFAFRLP
ncbi:hypothetical protein HDV63DRAFT_52113 [Trichoderma sp. SZMC 28014]